MSVLTWGRNISENKGTLEKGWVEIEDWGFSLHFVLRFHKNSIYTLHLCLSEDIIKWCKVYKKMDSWFQNSHEEFGKLQKSSEKPKSWNLMGCFCPKNIFLKPKHYTQAVSLTLLPTTSVKIHQMTYVIFKIISDFSRHNSSVFFELKNYRLSTKEAHQSANFQTFHCLR